MTGLDTNVLLRYLTQDDEAQLQAVLALLRKKGMTFFVSDLVLVELDWVLSSRYQWTPAEIAEAFGRLLNVHNLAFEDEGRIRSGLRALRNGADLSDEFIVARCHEVGCKTVATFDKGIAKRHPGFAVVPK